ncbi:protein FRG2-like-1 [Canis lupus baileyi]|uniref:Protein FRG2-like-1 n=2 Tax=Canis lupus familiaris TaxID=9615 RepID=A0A8C0PUW3_CANLF|nr:protein FRG2-like-1 [Canis lupus familiaris]XP_025277217.1 protein FRG2-like-1 [Canis lupus dingo]XP_038383911.1 protein FRG2-like-1 [Canis lupus familiaris]XP_038512005.1 protein FRG2-like-1 [Canis lupus familiaris]|eukprot:XP_003638901.1 protein FRG2-like-1 [Canis lupus familiaris]
MHLGIEGIDAHSPSTQHPTDQTPCQQNSKERGSDVEEKSLEGKEETFSSLLRQGCTQGQGSEPETDEENSKETELKRHSSSSGSELEGCSSWEGSRKRKISSSDSTCDGAGASPADEGSVTPGKKKRRASDHGRSSESQGTAPARPGRRWARGSGRSRRGRHSPRGDRPPPLRKALVTTLRALSEAIYQDVAQVCELQKHSPLTWEEQFGLGQLWGPLYSALQTVYTMANQAAYAFPAESWLLPGPPQDPGPQVPAADGREALGSPGERRGPTPPRGQS